MMIEMEYCLYNETSNSQPELFQTIWEYLYELYSSSGMIIAVDLEYLIIQHAIDIPAIPFENGDDLPDLIVPERHITTNSLSLESSNRLTPSPELNRPVLANDPCWRDIV